MLNTNVHFGKLLPPINQGGQVQCKCQLQNVISASIMKIRNLLLNYLARANSRFLNARKTNSHLIA